MHNYHDVKVCPWPTDKMGSLWLTEVLDIKTESGGQTGCGSNQILCPRKDILKVAQDLPFYNQVKPVPVVSAMINCSWNNRPPSPNNGLSNKYLTETSCFGLGNHPIRAKHFGPIRIKQVRSLFFA